MRSSLLAKLCMQGEEVPDVVREQDSSVCRSVLQLHAVRGACLTGVDGVRHVHAASAKRSDEGSVDRVLIEVERERHAQLDASESARCRSCVSAASSSRR
jgi:hypothetical protein